MSLDTITPNPIYPPIDACSTTLTAAHASGSGSLAVASGSIFGSPSSGSPLRLTGLRASDSARVHYLCTGVTGTTLTVAPMDGYSDLTLAIGDTIGCWASSETFLDQTTAIGALQVAVNQHAANAAPLASPDLTGNPTAPTPATSDNSTSLATTAFVKAQGYGTGGGSGTVTSVGLAVPSGLSVSGSPVTGSGTLTIATSLSGLVKGTGSGFAVASAGADYLAPTGNGSGLTGIAGSQIAGNIAGNAASITGAIAEGQVTGLAAALAALATIASPSFTGVITLGTLAGVLKGTAGVVSAATAGTDYVAPGTVTGFTAQQYAAQNSLTYASSVAWNLASQQAGWLTLTGNATLAAPTNMQAGGTYTLIVKQDGTGSRTLGFNAVFKWPGGTAPTLSTAANAVDVLTFLADGTSLYGSSLKAFA